MEFCSFYLDATSSVMVTAEDPDFAQHTTETWALIKGEHRQSPFGRLSANPATSVSLLGSGDRRTNCKKVKISWLKPAPRRAWLNYTSEDTAKRVTSKFMDGTYMIHNQSVSPRISPSSKDHLGMDIWTIILDDVPVHTSVVHIDRALQDIDDYPSHIELSHTKYSYNENRASVSVASLVLFEGPLGFTLLPSTTKRHRAVAHYEMEEDARSAVLTLNKKPQDFLNGKSLDVQLMNAAKFKVSTLLFDALEHQISTLAAQWKGDCYVNFRIHRNTDSRKVFTWIRLEGPEARHVAKAAESLETITAGQILHSNDKPIWFNELSGSDALRTLNRLQKKHDIVISRRKLKKELRYFGPADKLATVQREIAERFHPDRIYPHYVVLGCDYVYWLENGGMRKVNAVVGNGAVYLDLISNPRRIIVQGTDHQYRCVVATVRGKGALIDFMSNFKDHCCICYTEAEQPLRTQCGHLYCSECFENMCLSGGSGTEAFHIQCCGNSGQCASPLRMHELQDLLSSVALDKVLEASLESHVQSHPSEFRYCPTPDCDHIYRPTEIGRTHRCAKCFEVFYTSCHVHHVAMSCTEYQGYLDLQSGRHAAFERFKIEHGIKDCPKCGTPLEKTEGCNHVICGGCRAHICWMCLMTFAHSDECYGHMVLVHRGIGVDIPDAPELLDDLLSDHERFVS